MHKTLSIRNVGRMVLICVILGQAACQTSPQRSAVREPETADEIASAPTGQSNQPPLGRDPVSTYVDARPAALVDGEQVSWGELRPMLSEAAGAMILEEYVLDQMLRTLLEGQKITISESEKRAEQQLLLDSLSEDSDTAVRLLQESRARRGLGPVRFDQYLFRNAALRALVRKDISVTTQAIEQLHQLVYGPKRRARLITTPTLAQANKALARVHNSGETFADVAVDVSTDSSASRGGLLEPISHVDPSYPIALKDVMWQLAPGETSTPILLDSGYAIVQIVEEIPGRDVPLDQVADELEARVRMRAERIRVEQLARQLMDEASVTIFDRELQDSWNRRRRLRNVQ